MAFVPAVVVPGSVTLEPLRVTSVKAATLPFTVRSPLLMTVTFPPVLLMVSSTVEPESLTVISPPAVALRFASSRFSPIEPVALAVTVSARIRAGPEMLPAVALSSTSLADVTFELTTMSPPAVTATLPAVDVTPTSVIESVSVSVIEPFAVAVRELTLVAASIEPFAADAVSSAPETLPGPAMLPLVEVSVTFAPADTLPLMSSDPSASTSTSPATLETLPSVSPLDSVTENDPLEAPVTVATLVAMATVPLVAVAVSRLPVIRPLPLMLPAVALSATLEPAVMD